VTTTGKVPKTLSKSHFDFLRKQIEISPRRVYTKAEPLSYDKSRRRRELAKIRQQYQHIRDVAKKEMTDLTKLAGLLSDKQYNQLFSVEVKEFSQMLKILLTAFSGNLDDIRRNGTIPRRDISETKRIIMLKLLDWLLWEIGDWPNAIILASDSYDTLNQAGLSEYFSNVIGLKAILIEADKKCDTTEFKKRLLSPNIAERMRREGKIGFESGRS
jgi:hypothetical protein